MFLQNLIKCFPLFLTDATLDIENHVLSLFSFNSYLALHVSVKELFSLWAVESYLPFCTPFMHLPLFAFFFLIREKLSNETDLRLLFQNCILLDIFHICVCMSVSSFWNCDISLPVGRTVMCVANFFFETSRELLVILLISRHTHIISLPKALVLLVFLFIPDLLSHSPLNILWYVWYICLNMYISFYIVLFWVCMFYIYKDCCVTDLNFFSQHYITLCIPSWFWLQHVCPLYFIPFLEWTVTFSSLLSQQHCKKAFWHMSQ